MLLPYVPELPTGVFLVCVLMRYCRKLAQLIKGTISFALEVVSGGTQGHCGSLEHWLIEGSAQTSWKTELKGKLIWVQINRGSV